ncbi:MAG: porphobilinogen synthase [Armatimonadota bacterium]|nr:MAG: porphobilinogen synthase [Armatimonadota bacterium]
MGYPTERLRRLRRSPAMRRLVAETTLAPQHFIYPMFVAHGTGVKERIAAMPGQYRWSIDLLGDEARRIAKLGIGGILLFGVPAAKDEVGSEAYADDGIVQQAVRAIRDATSDLLVVTDVCLCEYTSHGHCGVVDDEGGVLNDPTLELLARTALSHARAGADIVAPSDMMDGRVGAIREALDDARLSDTAIMAYSAKYASAFYGPFREAAESAPQFGDRRGYQMDPPNSRQALREVELDIEEGADIVMVKPALAYLDVIGLVGDEFDVPVAAYNVSGEYSMVRAAAARKWIDGRAVTMEILTAIRRAGADIIITYHALEAARWLSGARG